MGNQYEKKYNDLMGCLRQMHERNTKRTRTALRSLLIIPTIFLVMLFFTNSSKTIFLVLWIVSMFIIASVLIVIEYQDFTLRKMIADVEGDETLSEIDSPAPETAFEYDNYNESPSEADDK